MSDDGSDDIETGEEGDPYTETSEEGLGDRLQGACAGICIGLLLFFGSFPLLFWNEGRAVKRYDMLNDAESQIISINPASIDPANEGKLLHFSADVTNGGGALVDPVFGIISNSSSLALGRDAEMYQWIEKRKTKTKKKVGGGKTTTSTYTYAREWRSTLINSQDFKRPDDHTNPSSMEFESLTMTADPILIGKYEFPRELVSRIDWEVEKNVDLGDITDQSIRDRANETFNGFGFYFDDSNIASPEIGDERVSFTETPTATATIVGVQKGNTLAAFVSESGEGGEVLLFQLGQYSAASMFEEANSANAVLSWLLRLAGFVCMSLGLYLVFRPIEVFADIVPCAGSIVGCGLIFVAVFISAILSVITISLAWLVAHPKIGAIVLVATLGVVGCCAFGVKKVTQMRRGDGDEDKDVEE